MTLGSKTAIVFGGTGGIGIELCKHLLYCGLSRLAILDLSELKQDIKDQIQLCNPTAEIFYERCDITNKNEMENIIRKTVFPKLQGIDIFINAAGILDERDPDRLISINLIGLINSSLLALQLMTNETPSGRGGIVVNVASVAGLKPIPFMPVYGASKFGVVGFTRSLGVKQVFDQTGVKFITICPGVTETTLIDRASEGEDLTFPWLKDETIEVWKHASKQSPTVVGKDLCGFAKAEKSLKWKCLKIIVRKIDRSFR